jgi:hypothetical protein
MSPGGSSLRKWRAAVIGGLLALILGVGASVALVAIGRQVIPAHSAQQGFQWHLGSIESGTTTFYGFQRVQVGWELHGVREPSNSFGGNLEPVAVSQSLRIAFSPIGGLLLIGFAIMVGARVAWRLQKPAEATSLQTALRTASVFAVAALAVSYVVSHRTITPAGSFNGAESVTLRFVASRVGSFLWPLAWGVVFGSLGAFIAAHPGDWRRQFRARVDSRLPRDLGIGLRAALSGLLLGLLLVVSVGAATGIVAIALHPADARDVFSSGKNVIGIAEGIVIGLPPAAGAGVLGSMGVPARYKSVFDENVASGNVSIFGAELESFKVPGAAVGGLSIALILTVLTGYRATTENSGGVSRAIRSAILAALFLTIFLWIIASLLGGSSTAVMKPGFFADRSLSSFTLYPSLLPAILLPLAWTLGGGFVGAMFGLAAKRSTNRPARVSE